MSTFTDDSQPRRRMADDTVEVAPPANEPRSGEDDASDAAGLGLAISATQLEKMLEQSAASQMAATRNATIAIVDDEALNVQMVRRHLQKAGYSEFHGCSEPVEALPLIRRVKPDLVLLDIMMPEVSGVDILHAVKVDPTITDPAILVMTASADARLKQVCLGLGASDFINKPLDVPELTARVRNTLMHKTYRDRMAEQNARLEEVVERRTAELVVSREEVVHCLARAAERRDDDTGHHVLRVGRYVAVIARQLGIPDERVEVLELAAQLHDVGKIGIPDEILFKPGRLDEQQIDVMRRHCAVGRQIIRPLTAEETRTMRTHVRLGADLLNVRTSPLLMVASRIAQTHHERWDGTGYPLGLAGTDIPIEGRMTAVADVFDALSSKRPYKDPFPRERCFEILEEGRGTHFDPDCLDAFFAASDEIVAIQLELMDDEHAV